jgi:hypothetical protein
LDSISDTQVSRLKCFDIGGLIAVHCHAINSIIDSVSSEPDSLGANVSDVNNLSVSKRAQYIVSLYFEIIAASSAAEHFKDDAKTDQAADDIE